MARRGLDREWVACAGRPYDLVLRGYPPERKIHSIKVLRELTGCGLAEGKAQVESLPAFVCTGVTRRVAEAGRDHFVREIGAPVRVVIVPSPAGTRINRAVAEPPDSHEPAPVPLPPDSSGPFDLVLRGYAPPVKLHVIYVLRANTGLSLTDCKALIEATPPVVLMRGVHRAHALAVRQQLGAQVLVDFVPAAD